MRQIFTVFACLILASCASGHKEFYKPYVDARTLPDVQMLGKGELPKIFSSNDLERDVNIAISKGYRTIGVSSFNGEAESEQAVVEQAKSVGAVLVLVNSKFTDSRAITTPLFLPDNQTTYHSGNVNGTYGSANYSGTSTTYGTKVVPITTEQQRYDQTAVYFVKSNQKYKFGLLFNDLTPEQRTQIERNMGVLINVVIEDSPAFYSNVLAGDVLIAVDGIDVKNASHATQLMGSISTSQNQSVLKVIRNGKEKDIPVKF